MNRVWMAMGAYVVLAILAWTQLTEAIPRSGGYQVRHVVLLVLCALAISTWIHRRDRVKDGHSDTDGTEGREQ
ncbi:MAG TPA: hypothetical protein VN577_16080 [Terriglobales bacterium]|nr:hypothetical protein [Terriglobales bacterium]